MAGALTISDRDASAMTITGGAGADNLRQESSSDVLTGGSGSDTLSIVQNAVLGGFQVDLSASGDQVTTYNGAANGAVQSGFENVDLSNVSGGFGASITAISTGSTITGTLNADVITGGAGSDTLNGGAGGDTITGGSGAATINGNAGTDTITASSAGGTITGGGDADSITTGAGTDIMALGITRDSATDFDTITGFTTGTDKIAFSAAVFDALHSGTPLATLITADIDSIAGTELGTNATTSVLIAASAGALTGGSINQCTDTETIIYITNVAEVYFNDDVAIANGMTKVADLGSAVTLAEADFLFTA
jgi:Ca2+-binding RTX toxin-like protein